MNMLKIEAELSKQQKIVNRCVLIFTLSAIVIDYLITNVFFIDLNASVHSVEVTISGCSIMVTVTVMTNWFRKLLKKHAVNVDS